jgi:antitoxin component of MazEF toxin-antitoxin module
MKIQLSKNGVFSVNIPIRLVRSLKLQKGEETRVVKGKNSNEIIITIERE